MYDTGHHSLLLEKKYAVLVLARFICFGALIKKYQSDSRYVLPKMADAGAVDSPSMIFIVKIKRNVSSRNRCSSIVIRGLSPTSYSTSCLAAASSSCSVEFCRFELPWSLPWWSNVCWGLLVRYCSETFFESVRFRGRIDLNFELR